MKLKDWPWMHLFYKIKPLLNSAEKRKEMDELKAEYEEMKKELEKEVKRRKELEEQYIELVQAKNTLSQRLSGQGSTNRPTKFGSKLLGLVFKRFSCQSGDRPKAVRGTLFR